MTASKGGARPWLAPRRRGGAGRDRGRLPGAISITALIAAKPIDCGDVLIARKDIPASYHLAVTWDDALQGVELVTRGE